MPFADWEDVNCFPFFFPATNYNAKHVIAGETWCRDIELSRARNSKVRNWTKERGDNLCRSIGCVSAGAGEKCTRGACESTACWKCLKNGWQKMRGWLRCAFGESTWRKSQKATFYHANFPRNEGRWRKYWRNFPQDGAKFHLGP